MTATKFLVALFAVAVTVSSALPGKEEKTSEATKETQRDGKLLPLFGLGSLFGGPALEHHVVETHGGNHHGGNHHGGNHHGGNHHSHHLGNRGSHHGGNHGGHHGGNHGSHHGGHYEDRIVYDLVPVKRVERRPIPPKETTYLGFQVPIHSGLMNLFGGGHKQIQTVQTYDHDNHHRNRFGNNHRNGFF